VSVEVDGWAEFGRAAGRIPAACQRAAATGARDAAAALVAATRGRVPKDSGRLAASVGAVTLPDGAAVTFGAGIPYAGWIEYGGTRGRPYVAAGRYLGAGVDRAAADYGRRTQTATDAEIGRLPWP
jgi:phage gpG-like protein